MITTSLSAVLAKWEAAARASAAALFDGIAARHAEIQTRIAALRTYPPSFDGRDLDAVLAQLYSARRMRRQILEGNDLDVLVPTLRAFLFDDEPLEQKFTTYPALIRYAGLPILGELFGWVHADTYPLYTQRALAALRRLGWGVPARSYPAFTAAFSALRQLYEAAGVRVAPELPLNLEIDQFLVWVSQQRLAELPSTAGTRSTIAAIREYGAAYDALPPLPAPARLSRREPDLPASSSWPDSPLPLPSPEHLARAEAAIRAQLALPPGVVRRAAAHLASGRHLILTGAPGTGKSHLALLLSRDLFGYHPMLVTATAEWSAFDVVGGLVPVADQRGLLRYAIRPGYVYEALRQNWLLDASGLPRHDSAGRPLRRAGPLGQGERAAQGVWLIIDELNRADVDKAFGELFSALESGVLRVPQPEGTGTMLMPIPRDFRIIATLNSRDRHFLFTLSDALKRRFAFLELSPPADPVEERSVLLRRAHAALAEQGLTVPDDVLVEALDALLPFAQCVRAFHPLGSAPLLAALRYVGAADSVGRVAAEQPHGGEPGPAVAALLDEAVAAEILPQLESVRDLPLAFLADLAAGRRDAIVPRLERELYAAGVSVASLHTGIAGLGRALRVLGGMAEDDAAIDASNALLEAVAAPVQPGAPAPALVAALQAARPVAARLLPRLSWPLVAAQLEAWLAERLV